MCMCHNVCMCQYCMYKLVVIVKKIMCDWLNMWLACDISHTGILCITQSLSGDESESTFGVNVSLYGCYHHSSIDYDNQLLHTADFTFVRKLHAEYCVSPWLLCNSAANVI